MIYKRGGAQENSVRKTKDRVQRLKEIQEQIAEYNIGFAQLWIKKFILN
jgi:hypothetical protein